MKKIPKIMGLDIGDARVGVALSDGLGISAQSFCVVNRGATFYRELLRIIAEQGVVKIVAGLPYELDGSLGPQGELVRKMLSELKSKLDQEETLKHIEICEWDERLTSVQAQRVLVGSGLKNKKRREATDKIAACIILQSYLDTNSVKTCRNC